MFYTHFLYNVYKKTLVKSVNIMLHSQKRLILKCHQTLKIPFKEHNGKQKEAIQSPSKLLTTIGTKTTTRLDHLTMGCIQNWMKYTKRQTNMFVDLTLMLTFNDIHTYPKYIPLDQLIHKSLIHRFIQDKGLDR